MHNVPIWEAFLTDRDKEHLARGWQKDSPFGFGDHVALIVVDNFADTVGEPGEDQLEAVLKSRARFGAEGWVSIQRTKELLGVARRAGTVIVHTTITDPVMTGIQGRLARAGSSAHTFHPDNFPETGELIVHKAHASAFLGTSLDAQLRTRGIDTVFVCGNSTSGCLRATVVDAAGHGFRVGIVEECVFDRTEAAHAMSLFDMDQKYGDVISIDEASAYLEAIRPS
jgi:nicotinamidase-related amidase